MPECGRVISETALIDQEARGATCVRPAGHLGRHRNRKQAPRPYQHVPGMYVWGDNECRPLPSN